MVEGSGFLFLDDESIFCNAFRAVVRVLPDCYRSLMKSSEENIKWATTSPRPAGMVLGGCSPSQLVIAEKCEKQRVKEEAVPRAAPTVCEVRLSLGAEAKSW